MLARAERGADSFFLFKKKEKVKKEQAQELSVDVKFLFLLVSEILVRDLTFDVG